MIEDSFKLAASPTIIQDKLDDIIESFVEFYGEDKRQNIEQKLRNTLILKFCNTENLDTIVTKIEQEIFENVFETKINFFYLDIDKLITILESGESDYIYLDENIVEICFSGEKDINKIIENYQKGLYPKVNEFIEKYKEIKPRLIPIEEQVERESKREKDLEIKYTDMLVSHFSYLFTEEEIKEYESFNMLTKRMRQYLGNSMTSMSNGFTPAEEELLHDPNASEWRIESIKKDRIEFFKSHGFNLSENSDLLNEPEYEDYLKIPECQQLLEEMLILAKKIEEKRKELNESRIKELVYELEDYQECQRYITERNFVNKNDALGPFVYQSPVSCCEMNFIKVGDKLVPFQLILINAGMSDINQTIIHELNHAYEAHVLEVDDKRSLSITGWDYETSEFKDKKEPEVLQYSGITRPYELMSEYINDRIAEDIREIMQSKGKYIFNKSESRSGSVYRYVDFLVEDFYLDFKPIIIESRSHGNIQYIYNKLGQENFEALNRLVNRYYEVFGFGLDGRISVMDYFSDRPCEHKEEIEQMINEKNAILEQMKIHMRNVEQTL